MGPTFTTFIFQMSFATTATTIVSGAIAERWVTDSLLVTNTFCILRFDFNAYCIFSLVNTIVYAVPAGWLWAERGFLYRLGVVDIAGNKGKKPVINVEEILHMLQAAAACTWWAAPPPWCLPGWWGRGWAGGS